MKKIVAILVSLFIVFGVFSCKVTAPSWTNIGNDGVYIENCRDTITYNQLDSICDIHGITRKLSDWSVMSYYNSRDDMMTQWSYTRNTDTLYNITTHNSDSIYIFTMRTLQNNSNE